MKSRPESSHSTQQNPSIIIRQRKRFAFLISIQDRKGDNGKEPTIKKLVNDRALIKLFRKYLGARITTN